MCRGVAKVFDRKIEWYRQKLVEKSDANQDHWEIPIKANFYHCLNTKPFLSLLVILLFCVGGTRALGADVNLPGAKDAGTPDFGPNVLIFDPSMTNIQEQLNAVIARQQRAQFGTNRYA